MAMVAWANPKSWVHKLIDGDFEGICGATIIASTWALTAAHCDEEELEEVENDGTITIKELHIESIVIGQVDLSWILNRILKYFDKDAHRFVTPNYLEYRMYWKLFFSKLFLHLCHKHV